MWCMRYVHKTKCICTCVNKICSSTYKEAGSVVNASTWRQGAAHSNALTFTHRVTPSVVNKLNQMANKSFFIFICTYRAYLFWNNGWKILQTMCPQFLQKFVKLLITRRKENIKNVKKNNPLCRGIEPRSPAWQAGILTTILTKIHGEKTKNWEDIIFLGKFL